MEQLVFLLRIHWMYFYKKRKKKSQTFSSWENVTTPLEVLCNASWEEDYNLFIFLTPWNRVVTLENGNLFSTGGPEDKMGELDGLFGGRGRMTGG